MKKLFLGVCAATVISAGFAIAASHSDPIDTRKNGMVIVGTSMGTLAGMAKGSMDFDQKAAVGALKGMNYVAKTFGDFFPEGSGDGDTTASPKIWEDAAAFKAALVKFEADTANAIANPPTDQASLGAALGAVGGNCKACHQVFRIKK